MPLVNEDSSNKDIAKQEVTNVSTSNVTPIKQFEIIRESKQDNIIWADRNPTKADQGKIWIRYVRGNDSAMYIFLRHPDTGTWHYTTVSS